MSRSSSIIILGGVIILIVCAMSVAAVMISRNYFTVSDQTTTLVASTPAIQVTTVVSDSSPTITGMFEATIVTGTAVPTSNAPLPTVTTAPATVISVLNTSVQYVLALSDLNIRSGPGTGYSVVGWVSNGQTAKVTGVSTDNGWWRVVCPNGSSGSCWVTARPQYTQPTSDSGSKPTATAITASCTDRAALVADVTVPDGTQFAPRSGFNKIWRLKNTGTCTWENSYKVVQAGGHLLGAMSTEFPLNATVAPGQTHDLIINMVSPDTPGTYQSDWKLKNSQGQFFGIGRNAGPFWVKIVVSGELNTIISGLIYQDMNQNGIYDSGEPLVSSREVWLVPNTACHVRNDPVTTALSGTDGRYTLKGRFSGSFCVGLIGADGFDDGVNVNVTEGQTMTNVNLQSLIPNGSISGFLWNDYCLPNENGNAADGNCVTDDNGVYYADGMIQPTETYISAVTVLLQVGSCANNNAVSATAVTDTAGKYVFTNLGPGTFCVSINATDGVNIDQLLPGEWTFPARGISYQEITLQAGDNAYPINFGWDYQFK